MSDAGIAEAARAYNDPVGIALAAETELTIQLGVIRTEAAAALQELLKRADVQREITEGLWDADVVRAVVLQAITAAAQAREDAL